MKHIFLTSTAILLCGIGPSTAQDSRLQASRRVFQDFLEEKVTQFEPNPTSTQSAGAPSPIVELNIELRRMSLGTVGHGSLLQALTADLPETSETDPTFRLLAGLRLVTQGIYARQFCSIVCRSTNPDIPPCVDTTEPIQLCTSTSDSNSLRAIIGRSTDPGKSPFVDDGRPDSQTPAGYTFFGQFIDHDLTATPLSLLSAVQNISALRTSLSTQALDLFTDVFERTDVVGLESGSTGVLDLDNVYGVKGSSELTNDTGSPGTKRDYGWFERQILSNGLYHYTTGKFDLRQVDAPADPTIFNPKKPTSDTTPISGFDFPIKKGANGPLIMDARNGENRILSQIQSIIELAHNDCIDHLNAPNGNALLDTLAPALTVFDACKRYITWTYQTIVVTDFLSRVLNPKAYARIAYGDESKSLKSPEDALLPSTATINTAIYSCNKNSVRIPIEFAGAAFRLGHSLVRNAYRLHEEVLDHGQLMTGEIRPIFSNTAEGENYGSGLEGGDPLRRRDVIDWAFLFDMGGYRATQYARPLDTLVARRLYSLPIEALPPDDSAGTRRPDSGNERNLPRRNFLRASQRTNHLEGGLGIANGIESARFVYQKAMLKDESTIVQQLLADRISMAGFSPDEFKMRAPLWIWMLAEAEATQHSEHLGEVGSHLVGEFMLASLRCDESSVLNATAAKTGWQPLDDVWQNKRYTMPNLIAYLQESQNIRLSSR